MVLLSVTVVAVSSLISDRPTLSYIVVSSLILFSTTVLLCLLFLPKVSSFYETKHEPCLKIYAIIAHGGSPVITSSGLTISANTRRFAVAAVDEKKELYYRAEVDA